MAASIVQADTFEKFMLEIKAITTLKALYANSGFAEYWYRGLRSDKYDLEPTLLRTIKDELSDFYKERDLNRAFGIRCAEFIANKENPVTRYTHARHHGLETRLLDWTTNPLTALYFACSPGYYDEPKPAFLEVVVMKPASLIPSPNVYIPGEGDAKVINSIKLFTWSSPQTVYYWNDEIDVPPPQHGLQSSQFKNFASILESKAFVLPFIPDIMPGRLSRQRSGFTLHLPFRKRFEKVKDKAIEKIIQIPFAKRNDFYTGLNHYGINHFAAFGDLDSLCKDLNAALKS